MNACNRGGECQKAVESDHRIANHMAMLASYVRLRRGEFSKGSEAQDIGEVLRLFDRIGAQVAAVAQLHRMLTASASFSSGDIGAQLGRLCEAFRNGPACDTVIEYSAEPGCILHASQILPVSQIVSEAVTNALKYGQKAGCAGPIRVGCLRASGGYIIVSVEDDGEGALPSQSTESKPVGIGFTMVAALASQVNGKIDYRSTQTGFLFSLTLPAAVLETSAQRHFPNQYDGVGA